MGSAEARRIHSVTFGDKNTWDDWRMIPSQRPSIAAPEIIEETAEANWIDGKSHDLAEVLTGGVQYGTASGSMSFIMLNPEDKKYVNRRWPLTRSLIMEYLHNRRRRIILDDEPEYYYEGRLQVSFQTGKDYSIMTVDYEVDKYRIPIQ